MKNLKSMIQKMNYDILGLSKVVYLTSVLQGDEVCKGNTCQSSCSTGCTPSCSSCQGGCSTGITKR